MLLAACLATQWAHWHIAWHRIIILLYDAISTQECQQATDYYPLPFLIQFHGHYQPKATGYQLILCWFHWFSGFRLAHWSVMTKACTIIVLSLSYICSAWNSFLWPRHLQLPAHVYSSVILTVSYPFLCCSQQKQVKTRLTLDADKP